MVFSLTTPAPKEGPRLTVLAALVGLMLATVIVVAVGDRAGLPWPVLLVLLTAGALLLPGLPDLEVPAEMILPIFLPPLLWALARRTSWGSIRAQLSTIVSLSVLLVFVTVAALAGTAMWLMPGLGLAGAIVLAAALAPPDPVAVDAVAEPVGIPRRITSALASEGLFNDAASIVTFHLGLAALLAGEDVSFTAGALDFVWAVIASVVIGLLAGRATAWFTDHVGDTTARSALSWVVPFAVYLLAEEVHASGIIAVVIAAVELTSRASLGAEDRLSGGAFWGTVEMLFTGVAFGLIGLSVRDAVDEVGAELWHAVWVGAVLAVVAVAVRAVWLWLLYRINIRRGRRATAPLRLQEVLLMTWSGMRGLVTLALVLSIPATASDTLHHEAAVIALVVLLLTMVLPGLTLPALMRTLDLVESPEQVDHLHDRARRAARDYLAEHTADLPEEAVEAVGRWVRVRFDEHESDHGPDHEEIERWRGAAHKMRLASLRAAQQELLSARRERGVDPGAVDEVLQEIDRMILAARG